MSTQKELSNIRRRVAKDCWPTLLQYMHNRVLSLSISFFNRKAVPLRHREIILRSFIFHFLHLHQDIEPKRFDKPKLIYVSLFSSFSYLSLTKSIMWSILQKNQKVCHLPLSTKLIVFIYTLFEDLMTYYEQKKEAISSLHLYSNNSLKNEKRENLRAMKSGNFCMDEQSTLHVQMASN